MIEKKNVRPKIVFQKFLIFIFKLTLYYIVLVYCFYLLGSQLLFYFMSFSFFSQMHFSYTNLNFPTFTAAAHKIAINKHAPLLFMTLIVWDIGMKKMKERTKT